MNTSQFSLTKGDCLIFSLIGLFYYTYPDYILHLNIRKDDINTINIKIRYFDIQEYPRYDILFNEISQYSQNIELLPSTTYLHMDIHKFKFSYIATSNGYCMAG